MYIWNRKKIKHLCIHSQFIQSALCAISQHSKWKNTWIWIWTFQLNFDDGKYLLKRKPRILSDVNRNFEWNFRKIPPKRKNGLKTKTNQIENKTIPFPLLWVRGGGGGGGAWYLCGGGVNVACIGDDECVRVTPSSKFELNILIGV